MELIKFLVLIWVILVGISSNATATTILPLYASSQGFTDVGLYDISLEWGTITLDVKNGVAHYLIEIDQDTAKSVYGEQKFYIHNFGFMSEITFDTSNIDVITPNEPWIMRSPGGDHFDYELALWAYDSSPETAPSFSSMELNVNNLPLDVTDATFLEVNTLVQEVYGYEAPWSVSLRFPNNNVEGLPNTLHLYSNVSGETSTIDIDIKPQSCPNPLNFKSKGVLPVAILGNGDFDVTTIDPASIRLEGIAPIRSNVEDVSTPIDNQDMCDCTVEGSDDYDDLTLKFNTQEIVATLGDVDDGDVLVLTLGGKLNDGTPIEGEDCIIVLSKGNVK